MNTNRKVKIHYPEGTELKEWTVISTCELLSEIKRGCNVHVLPTDRLLELIQVGANV